MMNKGGLGSDLMNQINEGKIAVKSSKFAEEVRNKMVEAMTELITFGARIRPLMLRGHQVGWVKAVPYNEKRQFDIWYSDEESRIERVILSATTLSKEELDDLDNVELNAILKVILSMNLADLSLYPYVSAFVSTNASFRLWASHRSALLTSKSIIMPDGKGFKQLSSPDIIQLWASLCQIRENTIQRLENAQNAGTIARAFVGKGADNYNNAITKALNTLRTDAIEPWMEIINFLSVKTDVDLEDGFGHSHQDNSTEGLMRELKGMNEGDKHEQLMEAFHKSQLKIEDDKRRKAEDIIRRRREILESEEQMEMLVVRTEAEVKQREREIHQRRYGWVENKQKSDLLNQREDDSPDEDRLSRYV